MAGAKSVLEPGLDGGHCKNDPPACRNGGEVDPKHKAGWEISFAATNGIRQADI